MDAVDVTIRVFPPSEQQKVFRCSLSPDTVDSFLNHEKEGYDSIEAKLKEYGYEVENCFFRISKLIYPDGRIVRFDAYGRKEKTSKYGRSKQEVLDMLEQYSTDNFLEGFSDDDRNPYLDLMYKQDGNVDESEIRYLQYLEWLREYAVNVRKCNPSKIEYNINRFRLFITDNTRSVHKVKQVLDHLSGDPTDELCLLPLMCGSGKSTALSYLIMDVIERNEMGISTDGVVVVTDSVKRFEKYISPTHDEDMKVKQYLEEHRNFIVTVEHGTRDRAMTIQKHVPVVMLTTQRYREMSVNEVNKLLIWEKGVRPLIIIDEMIELTDTTTVSLSMAWSMLGVMDDGIISKDEVDLEEKNWAVGEWTRYCQRFSEYVHSHSTKILQYNAKQDDISSRTVLYYEGTGALTDDDKRFVAFLEQKKQQLQRLDSTFFKKLDTFRRIEKEGVIYWHEDKAKYGQHTMTVMDSLAPVVTDVNAQVIIMDGTADISPCYDILPAYKYPCDLFARRLDNLTIHFIYEKTNGSDFAADRSHHIHSSIIKDLKERSVDFEKAILFTHKNELSQFGNDGFQDTEYFGNIKGRNDLISSCIVQVGLFNFPTSYYFYYSALRFPEVMEELKHLSSDEDIEAFCASRIDNSDDLKDLRDRMLLSDLEQNMFRSSIREPACVEDVHFFVYCDTERYSSLIQMAEERYKKLGAKVLYPSAEEIRQKKVTRRLTFTGKMSDPNKIREWYKNLQEGTEYTYDTIASIIQKDIRYVRSLLSKPENSDIKALIQKDLARIEKKKKKYIKRAN